MLKEKQTLDVYYDYNYVQKSYKTKRALSKYKNPLSVVM